MEEKNKRCFLYVLEEDGLHLYAGTYHHEDCGWEDKFEYFHTDDGDIIDVNQDGYDPTINVIDERDDESVRSEIRKYLQESIMELQKKLSALEKEIILEKSEEEA